MQAGEDREGTGTPATATGPSRWTWVEPAVWTPRMLTALEAGVKGGKWFSLIDKVWSPVVLEAAYRKVRSNKGAPGIDNVTIGQFGKRLDREIGRLSEELRTGRYQPQAVKRTYISKPGSREKRPLGIPTVRDRVVQTALRKVVEPIFERDFARNSYGFRPGRSCKDALREVDKALNEGLHFVVDADIKSYFDSIPHDRLMELVGRKVSDGRVLTLVRQYLDMKVMDGLATWQSEEGTPQGAVISPLLSNIYLDPLDRLMERSGFKMARYADDFVILTSSRESAEAALAAVRVWMTGAGLTLHPEKTRVVDASQKGGFEFLGYHFERAMKWVRRKSIKKLKEKIKPMTKRANGHSLKTLVARLNPILRGWFVYFKHGHPNDGREIDGWVRSRLRAILRKRRRLRGRSRGADHQRWPNAYFADLGLFSLAEARKQAVQSARQ
jgi:RNA-directed DNA polymerase